MTRRRSSELTLTWVDEDGLDNGVVRYEIMYRKKHGPSWLSEQNVYVNTPATIKVITNLQSNSEYEIWMQSMTNQPNVVIDESKRVTATTSEKLLYS